jgi:rod shape-determining protein MreD
MYHHGVRGVAGAFILGYALDTFSGTVFGLNAFAMTLVYVGVYLVARMLWTEGGVPSMAVVFVAALGRGAALALGAAFLSDARPFWEHLTRRGLFDAAAAALVAPLVFALIGREKRIVGRT